VDAQSTIGAWRDSDTSRKIEGGWHNEALVVVRVFANQVDAPWRPKEARVCAEVAFELRNEIGSDRHPFFTLLQ
jgi:hypothetical protein